jgi:hypothetical protein
MGFSFPSIQPPISSLGKRQRENEDVEIEHGRLTGNKDMFMTTAEMKLRYLGEMDHGHGSQAAAGMQRLGMKRLKSNTVSYSLKLCISPSSA